MKDRSYSTKAVVEAGLISTLIVVIMLANVYVPVFSLIGMLILPIPVTVLYIRHNYKVTLGAVIVSSVIIAIIYNPIAALKILILLSTTGITLGYCVKHKKSASTTLMLLTVAAAIAIAATVLILSYLVMKQNFVEFLNQNVVKVMQDSLSMTKEMYTNMGVSKDKLDALKGIEQFNSVDVILKNIFTILFMSGFMLACLNYSITRIILKKLKYEVEDARPFNEFYVSSKKAAMIAIFLLIGLLLNKNKIPIGESITMFGYFILQFILLLNGLALASYYLRKKLKMSNLISNLVLILAAFSQLYIILVYLGFVDIVFDFRKLDPNRRPKVE